MSVNRMGPTSAAMVSFGVHPVGMKNAVMMPHAMNTAMLGRIMFDKNEPNLCTPTRVCPSRPGLAVDDVVVIVFLLFVWGCRACEAGWVKRG